MGNAYSTRETVKQAQREYSNIISNIKQNFILLKHINTGINCKWVEGTDNRAFGMAAVELGWRGLYKSKKDYKKYLSNYDTDFWGSTYGYRHSRSIRIFEQIVAIINYYEHARLLANGFYVEPDSTTQ